MRAFRIIGYALLAVATVVVVTPPVSAQTVSVTRTITVTARVADRRSIIVNDSGQMTKIFSNTNLDVMPEVFVNGVPGEARPLTPALLQQYRAVMAQQRNVVGVEIPVGRAIAEPTAARNFLLTDVSANFDNASH